MPGPEKTRYQVVVAHSIETTVEVDAESPEAALAIVNRATYKFPERDQWLPMDDWTWNVLDADDEDLLMHANSGPGTAQWQPEEDAPEEDPVDLLQNALGRSVGE